MELMILFDSSPETIAETLQSDVEIAAALPEENFRTQSAEALVETEESISPSEYSFVMKSTYSPYCGASI